MTFYEIVFGVLFLAALRLFLIGLGDFLQEGPELMLSGLIIGFLVISDLFTTTSLVESGKARYSPRTMFLDAFSALLLSVAMLSVDPNPTSSVFGIADFGIRGYVFFWLALLLYFFSIHLWNIRAHGYLGCPVWCGRVQPAFSGWFALCAALSWQDSRDSETSKAASTLILVITAVLAGLYLLAYKPFVVSTIMGGRKRMSQVLRFGAMFPRDEEVVARWPKYQELFAAYNYALHGEEKWLNKAGKKYGAWLSGNLVAFSILEETKLDESPALEFFLVVRADYLNTGIGTRLTEYTLERAFYSMGRSEVFLRVRDWNKLGLRVYKKCGFVVDREIDEDLPGPDGALVNECVVIMKAKRPETAGDLD